MIALFKHLSGLVVCALLASAPAWAADAPAAPWSDEQDAQVERGVQAYDAGDHARAKDILLPLAQEGHPKAMNMIGLLHKDTGVFPNNPNIKCDWYERAAEAGYVSGMYNLSTCYNDGNGRPKDHEQMLHWRTMAAESGSTNAMINLAGLDTSQGEAYRRWMNRAAQHGSRYALVSLWLQGYKHDAWSGGMTAQDIVCVAWHVLILDKHFDVCD